VGLLGRREEWAEEEVGGRVLEEGQDVEGAAAVVGGDGAEG